MDVQRYRNRVETATLDEGYEPITDGPTGPFDPVWHKQTDDPTIGVTEDFVTVVDAEGFDPEGLREMAETFRNVVNSISPSQPGGRRTVSAIWSVQSTIRATNSSSLRPKSTPLPTAERASSRWSTISRAKRSTATPFHG